MRFILTGSKHDIEMIGEQVQIPTAPGEVFAVHPNVFTDMRATPYAVTHVETGFRIGGGASIQSAILAAQNACLNVGPEEMARRIDLARDLRRSVAVSKK